MDSDGGVRVWRIVEECVQGFFLFIFVFIACELLSWILWPLEPPFPDPLLEVKVAAVAAVGASALYLNRKLRTKG